MKLRKQNSKQLQIHKSQNPEQNFKMKLNFHVNQANQEHNDLVTTNAQKEESLKIMFQSEIQEPGRSLMEGQISKRNIINRKQNDIELKIKDLEKEKEQIL